MKNQCFYLFLHWTSTRVLRTCLFCFALLFFVCPIRCASKIARLKNRVHGIKFVHPCWNCFPPSNQRHVWNFKKKAILIQSKKFQKLSTGIWCFWIKLFMTKFLLSSLYWWVFSLTMQPSKFRSKIRRQ